MGCVTISIIYVIAFSQLRVFTVYVVSKKIELFILLLYLSRTMESIDMTL